MDYDRSIEHYLCTKLRFRLSKQQQIGCFVFFISLYTPALRLNTIESTLRCTSLLYYPTLDLKMALRLLCAIVLLLFADGQLHFNSCMDAMVTSILPD